MEIKNCRRCGKMFSYMGGMPICGQCKQKEEEDFQLVKKYLYDHSGASMQEVSDACEVSAEKITRFLREGRLEVREGSNVVLECEKCGKSIRSGRLCIDCSKQLEKDISSVVASSAPESSKEEEKAKGKGGMRYLANEK